MIHGIMVDIIKLQAAKLNTDPFKCALNLLSTLFTSRELVNGNPNGVTNSKDPVRQRTIKKLDPNRMKYICGMFLLYDPALSYFSGYALFRHVQGKWPEKFSLVHRKLTQKCTDLYNSKKELRDE
jgi:hypothetical protein